MARVLLVYPGPGSPDLLSLEAWQALSAAPVFCAPGDALGARLRENGVEATELDEADPARLVSETGDAASGMRGRNLLAHTHAEVPGGARALAQRIARLAEERGEICFIVHHDTVVRAVMQQAFEAALEVEVVIGRQPRGHRLLELVRVMARLRGPGGCPWDAEQTHQTLAKHLLDETYELLDAIESGDEKDIAEELGDLLLQVVFHAQMGADADAFDIDDVSQGLVDKLVRRHPHVFGDVEVSGAREVVANWDAIKQDEKQRESVLDGVPASLPALAFAQKMQRRAGAAGFDWADASGALAKVHEEAEELARETDRDARERELGDLLFSMVALSRHLEIDAETALRRAARTFADRLRAVEATARDRGVAMKDMSDDELERLWEGAKAR